MDVCFNFSNFTIRWDVNKKTLIRTFDNQFLLKILKYLVSTTLSCPSALKKIHFTVKCVMRIYYLKFIILLSCGTISYKNNIKVMLVLQMSLNLKYIKKK